MLRVYRRVAGLVAALLALATLAAIWWGVVRSARAAPLDQAALQAQATPTQPAPTLLPAPPDRAAPPNQAGQRERQGDPNAPLISFIDSPSATCYQPVRHTDICYVQWQYLNVTASSSQYIISMTVEIDGKFRAYYGGFFQTSMYIPGDMSAPGFRVTCGPPGAGGNPSLGSAYSYTLRARETGGLKAANYGTVYCPADIVPPELGRRNRAYSRAHRSPL